ncbi:MAG: alpha/beta hydrolase-fold protein [Candidatus Sericytochromatia bacterium]|nr:alpha/beta hydrolase-fold protein [Candidatus Sericytochromatia bacterium]
MKSPSRTVQLDPPGRPRRRGRLMLLGPLQIPSLGRTRTVAVYLPPGYDPKGSTRYPVTYLFDGQNLFDPYTSFSGDWEVDLTVDRLTAEGAFTPGIMVGIYNGEGHRISEQSPWPDAHYGCTGEGDKFIDWVAGGLADEINHRFLTLTGPANTGIGGSSMGGLTALYALFRRPDAFGRALVMSPSLWFARGAIFDHVAAAATQPKGSRVYLDFGGREMRAGPGTRLLRDARIMKELLVSVGFTAGEDLLWIEDPTGIHNEACWAARLPRALSFLWPPTP